MEKGITAPLGWSVPVGRLRGWGALCCAFVLAACAGTSTGNPFDDNGPASDLRETTPDVASGEGCREQAQSVALDAQTPLQMRPAEALALAAGRHELSVRWLAHDDLEYGPEHGRGRIFLEIEPSDGVRYVASEPGEPAAGEGPTPALAPHCEARIEIDVQVRLASEAGALDETFEATLQATQADEARLVVRVPWNELQGELTLRGLHGGWRDHVPGDLRIETRFAHEIVQGELGFPLEFRSPGRDGTASQSWVRLALWPAEGAP